MTDIGVASPCRTTDRPRGGWAAGWCIAMGTFSVAACQTDPPNEGPPVEVFQEDGATVVVNRAPEHPPGLWRVGETPLLQIGEADGEEPYLFERIEHAQTLEDGRIVIVDTRASSIRIFSAEGRHLASKGRAGRGPGEFQAVTAVDRLPGDTLALTQFPNVVHFFDADGDFVRQWTGSYRLAPSAYLSTQRFLWLLPAPAAPGFSRTPDFLVVGSADGPGTDTVAALSPRTTLGVQTGMGMVGFLVPFLAGDRYAVDLASRLVHTRDGAEVVFVQIDGGSELRARFDVDRRPVTEGAWDDAVAAIVEARGPDDLPSPRDVERAFDGVERPSFMPEFDLLVIDRLNHVWARRFEPGDADAGPLRNWWVVSPDGLWLTVVALPSDLAVLEIAEDRVVGGVTDEFGVQRLRVYTLDRGL